MAEREGGGQDETETEDGPERVGRALLLGPDEEVGVVDRLHHVGEPEGDDLELGVPSDGSTNEWRRKQMSVPQEGFSGR